jgi:hypothetical protein
MDAEGRQGHRVVGYRSSAGELEPEIPIGGIPQPRVQSTDAQGDIAPEERRGGGDEVLDDEPFDDEFRR